MSQACLHCNSLDCALVPCPNSLSIWVKQRGVGPRVKSFYSILISRKHNFTPFSTKKVLIISSNCGFSVYSESSCYFTSTIVLFLTHIPSLFTDIPKQKKVHPLPVLLSCLALFHIHSPFDIKRGEHTSSWMTLPVPGVSATQ